MNTVSKDFEVTAAPQDGVSDLAFSPAADFLSASCWDNQTRIWEVQPNGNTVPKMVIPHEQPALCTTWSKDGMKCFSGGADKAGRMLDLQTGQVTQIAGHDAPIKCMRWIDNVQSISNMLVTGSWDRTIRFWDLRQSVPAHTYALPERCYAMDLAGPLLVTATAERHISIFDLRNPTREFKRVLSPLKFQTRSLGCFPVSQNGFAIGSIEGRIGIQYVEEKDAPNNFSFRCHRKDQDVYSVNAISFHPLFGTFSTAGADGTISWWDKDSKQRIKALTAPNNMPVTATAFNRNGSIFAYAACYDWSKGHEHYTNQTCKIMLHPVKEEDIKPRPKKR
ncbi:hypothetical protein CXG81DRAFT_9848 [Caulochytrium protostelioides]|uniref:WD40 repeat-like protein n=1 Tax=Caulochytrium protostelioides TaxID=1555241 RepID=A0A4P9XCL5_9FUNG|nr:hypothetical protein CXG81DRAFT_9848 [Caulochytrium protostelioides]|eukprot:RKP03186.1 hypothetical protein CXG81DRAFT_9848 [Caulochytrium protostelioides]